MCACVRRVCAVCVCAVCHHVCVCATACVCRRTTEENVPGKSSGNNRSTNAAIHYSMALDLKNSWLLGLFFMFLSNGLIQIIPEFETFSAPA